MRSRMGGSLVSCATWRDSRHDLLSPTAPRALVEKNRRFYDTFWAGTYLTKPSRFNTWTLISGLWPDSPQRLEIDPGLRPRLAVKGTHILDLSPTVVAWLKVAGGLAVVDEITALLFRMPALTS